MLVFSLLSLALVGLTPLSLRTVSSRWGESASANRVGKLGTSSQIAEIPTV